MKTHKSDRCDSLAEWFVVTEMRVGSDLESSYYNEALDSV